MCEFPCYCSQGFRWNRSELLSKHQSEDQKPCDMSENLVWKCVSHYWECVRLIVQVTCPQGVSLSLLVPSSLISFSNYVLCSSYVNRRPQGFIFNALVRPLYWLCRLKTGFLVLFKKITYTSLHVYLQMPPCLTLTYWQTCDLPGETVGWHSKPVGPRAGMGTMGVWCLWHVWLCWCQTGPKRRRRKKKKSCLFAWTSNSICLFWVKKSAGRHKLLCPCDEQAFP